jgi:hypothetical protein
MVIILWLSYILYIYIIFRWPFGGTIIDSSAVPGARMGTIQCHTQWKLQTFEKSQEFWLD